MINDWLRLHIKENPKIDGFARRMLSVVPYAARLGDNFWQWYAFYEESEGWSLEKFRQYHLEHLQSLLTSLKNQSRYYARTLSSLDPLSITSLDDFTSKVPAISRDDFRENFQEILNPDWRKQRPILTKTSGTTGNALQFYHSYKDRMREWAAICHQWKRVGFDPAHSWRAEFRGLISRDHRIANFPEKKYVRCSILHLNPSDIKLYGETIQKYSIEFLHGYPSAIFLLARSIQENNLAFPQPKAILLASEMVYDWQIYQIQAAFPSARLFAHYGCAERTVLAGWCETRREYHVLPQYALVEIDPVNSEIIGTNLFNTINGFLRYRMTDSVLDFKSEICPDCRRPYFPRLVKLGGRMEDYLYSPQKGWIPPAIVTYPLKNLKFVRELQFYQKERDVIKIRYLPEMNHPPEQVQLELDTILQGMSYLVGSETAFQFEQVDDFPRSTTGKFRWIVCELDEIHHLMEGVGKP